MGGPHIARCAANPPRRKLARTHGLLRVGGIPDVRDAHCVRTELQGVADHVLVVALHPHDCAEPGIVGRAYYVLEGRIDGQGCVLAIDENVVESGVSDDLHDRQALGVETHAENRFVSGQGLAQLVDSHSMFSI